MPVPTQHQREREANSCVSRSTAQHRWGNQPPAAFFPLQHLGWCSASRAAVIQKMGNWLDTLPLNMAANTDWWCADLVLLRQRVTWNQALTVIQGASLCQNWFITAPIIYSISWWSADLLLKSHLGTVQPPRAEPWLPWLLPELWDNFLLLGYAAPL